MKIILIDPVNPTPIVTFNVVGRTILQSSDILSIEIVDEYNDFTKTDIVTFINSNEMNYITINNSDDYFKHTHKYNFKLLLDSEVFYEGQMICLNEGENVQDFKHTEITNNKLKF